MLVFDRILNKEIPYTQIEQPIPFGRYVFTSNQNEISLNDCKINANTYLVPCNGNEGFATHKIEKTKLNFSDNELFNENSLLRHAITDVSEELEIIDELSDINQINTLLRNFDKRLDITEFEILLEKKLFHIEEICREPSYHLKREISKVNIGRAKRIPVKAINYLASHSEDWSRRRIRSVEPRRILSEIIEYDLTIYENKITSNFIDKLLLYFANRMVNEVDVIDEFIKKIEEVITSREQKNNDIVYWHKKVTRDYAKLGEAVKSIENSRKKIEVLKKFIATIQLRLFSLLTSELYRSNSKSKKSNEQKLKRTNLFDNHQHYRFIKILWENLHKQEELTCGQKAKENQKAIKAYIDYSWVIILRALFQLGYNVTNEEKNSLKLTNRKIPSISISLSKNEFDIISVSINNDKILKFIPVPISKNIQESNLDNTFIIALAQSNKAIRLSPSDINSEERITTLLFNAILEELKNKHLFKLNSQDIAGFKIIRTWLQKNETLILNKSKTNTIDFWLKRKLNKQEQKSFLKSINKQKQEINKHPNTRDKALKKLDSIKKHIEVQAKLHFENYEICLGCGTKKESSLTVTNKEGFQYKCTNKDCQISYGYKNEKLFYKVPDLVEIEQNLLRTNQKLDKETLLNAFGYEYH